MATPLATADSADTVGGISCSARRYINGNPGEFSRDLDRTSFGFTHNLVGHPLFKLDRLAKLAETVLAAKNQSEVISKVAESVPNIAKQWANFSPTERVAEAIANIENSGSWVMISGAQIDPEYDALLNSLVDELEVLTTRRMREDITWIDAYVFIGSPNSVTHIHIDSETNFLFQVHGTKEAHLFDRDDRSIVSEIELERFFSGEPNALSYRPEIEAEGKVYDFRAGNGIHIPVNAPHWIKNLNDYSVTFSVLFYTRPFDKRARVYQVNHLLRRCGLKPMPPGVSPLGDTLKSSALGLLTPKEPASKEQVLRGGAMRLRSLAEGVRRLVFTR